MSNITIITGGSSGIGKALAIFFAEKGEQVLVIGRDHVKLDQINTIHNNIDYICGDLSESDIRKEVLNYVESKKLNIKYLIHAAGIIKPIKPIIELNQSDWNKMQDINVTVPVIITSLLSKNILDNNGRVLFLTSNWGTKIPVENISAYCVSKAALSMAYDCIKLENPRLNLAMLNPGGVETEMMQNIKNSKKFNTKDWTIKSPGDVAEYAGWILESTNDEDYTSEIWDLTLGK